MRIFMLMHILSLVQRAVIFWAAVRRQLHYMACMRMCKLGAMKHRSYSGMCITASMGMHEVGHASLSATCHLLKVVM